MAIINLPLVLWWQSFPEWSMVSQLDIMIISMSDTNGQLVVRFTSNLSVVLLLCSSDGPHLNDSLFLNDFFLETVVQVVWNFLQLQVLWIVWFWFRLSVVSRRIFLEIFQKWNCFSSNFLMLSTFFILKGKGVREFWSWCWVFWFMTDSQQTVTIDNDSLSKW